MKELLNKMQMPLIEATNEDLKELYGIDSLPFLNDIDITIANIILSIQPYFKENVYELFEKSIILSNEKPEIKVLEHLIDKANKSLQSM